MKSLQMFALACSVAGLAWGVNVTSDTTVTEADVANYAAADIDVAAGATLCFHNLSTARTFSGRLTGGGAFVVKSDAENVAARITFAGDATGFTGGIYVTNHLVTAAGPAALGPSPFTLRMTAKGQFCYLNGAGDYTCPMDVAVCDTHPKGLVVATDAVLAGPVSWRMGRICGPGSVTGLFTILDHVYGQADIHFKGGVTRGKLYSDSGVFYLDAPAIGRLGEVSVTGGTMHLGCDDGLDPQQGLGIGAGYNPCGTYNLHGHDLTVSWIRVGNTKPEGEDGAGFTSAEAPATLTILNQSFDQTLHGNFKGQASLDYASASGNRLLLCGLHNDTSGKITVRSGTVAANTNAVFSALSRIEVTGSGTFEIAAARNAALGVMTQPAFDLEKVALVVSEDGKVKVPADAVFEVNAATVDGVALAPGRYTKDSEGVGAHIVGDGVLAVLALARKEEGATFVWKGGTDGDAIRAAANWQGGVAPAFDGTERLVFGPDGSATAVVSGTVDVFAIDVTGNRPFTLAAADADAKVVLEQGGLSLTNTVDDAVVTHVQACPVELGFIPQTWTVGGDVRLENQAPLSGPQRVVPLPLVLRAFGRVSFKADNSSLYPQLVISNLAAAASQPHVYDGRGLGSPTRETMIVGCVPRFMTSLGPITNAVPIRFRNNAVNADHAYINESGAHPLYMDGRITYVDISGECYVNGNVHFRGGITREGNQLITLRTPGGNNWIEGDCGVRTPGEFAVDYGGVLNLVATNNAWSQLSPYKCTVKCHARNALPPGRPVRLSSTGVYLSKASVVDLNGFDQSVSRLYAGFVAASYPDYYVTVQSETPATLEIAQAGTVDDLVPLRVLGAAGLRFDAPGRFAFTNALSTTTGSLEVRKGTVSILAGAGWTATTNVVVGAAGTLEVGTGAGATALGERQGKSAADVTLEAGGQFRIAAGETVAVHSLTLAGGADGKDRFANPGYYGAAGTAGVTHVVDWVLGGGRLQVVSTLMSGTIMLLR